MRVRSMDHQQEDKQPCEDQCQVERSQTPFPANNAGVPPCHRSLMAISGRLVWIKSVLRAVPIYAMMAENLPSWVRKEIDAIWRKFFWVGSDASIQGKCMVESVS